MDYAIGDLARRTGVKVPTIRYYEQIGLLPEPPRTEGKQRRYSDQNLRRLTFIRHARELGFGIEAIRELTVLSDRPDTSCAEADRIARHHLVEVEERITKLEALRAELERMIGECAQGRVSDCRVIQSLADHRLCCGEH
jgi:DNA-binding transcriptional MerR regulator